MIDHVKLLGTTDGSGDASETASVAIYGCLVAVEWAVGSLATGVDAVLSVTKTTSGVDHTLLTLTDANANGWYYPRATASDNAGAAIVSYVEDVIQGHLKLVIAQGGDTKTGGCVVYFEG